MANLYSELKRRKVFRMAVLYLIVAWPLIEAGDIFLPTFNAPAWANQALLIAYLAGFPIAILLAWFLQITPDGIKADYGAGNQDDLVYAFFSKLFKPINTSVEDSPDKPEIPAAAPTPVRSKSIAVLPLQNLSPNPDNAYFASGVHEEILDQLTKISDLKVISRTAVLRYEGTTISPSQIANELRVSTIMEGSVRFAANKVRITTQLIRAEDDMHIWSECYEFELDDIFLIQSDVAKNVASAMQATLLPSEIKNIERPATESSQAYTLFLRHRYHYAQEHARPDLQEDGWLEAGIRKMQQAIELDPRFARGIAELGWLLWYKGLLSGPKIQHSLYDQAISFANKALAIDPNISRAYQVLQRVYFHRREWGKWEDYARKSVNLPDLEGSAAFNLALTLALVAHYEEAYYWFDIVVAKVPSFPYYWELAVTTRVSGGDYEKAIDYVEQYLAVGGDPNAYHTVRAYCFYRQGKEQQFLDEFKLIEDYKLQSVFIPQLLDFMRSLQGEKDAVLANLMQLPDDFTKGSRIIHCAAAVNDLDLVFFAYQSIMDNNGHIHFSEIISDDIKNDKRFKAVEKYMNLPRIGEYMKFV